MYPILDIKNFVSFIISGKDYYIGKDLIYNTSNYYFSENDEKFIKYIYEIIIINKNNTITNSIIIPLIFTMKRINGDYILSTRKTLPEPLNKNEDIFLYDRNIYIPTQKQVDLYKVIYKYIKENNKIIFKGDINNKEFGFLNKVLISISKNIFYDEAIINKINEELKINFNFSRKNGKSVCDVVVKNNIIDMSYSDAIKINSNKVNISKGLIKIESILNKYRFYYRNESFEFLGNDEEYYLFLNYGIDEISSIGNMFIEKLDQEYFKLSNGGLKDFTIKEKEKGMYEFYMQLENISSYELNNVVKAYRENKNFIKLDNDTYVDLKSCEFEKIIKIIDSLNLDIVHGKDKFYVSIDKLYYLKEKIENYQIPLKNRKKILNLFKAIKEKQDNIYDIPENLKCNLRDYQIKGYNWFRNLSELGLGGVLGDEMGLGKTVQTAAFLASEKKETSMIIVPTSLLYNWKNEFEKFIPDLRICLINGEKKKDKSLLRTIMNMMLSLLLMD